MIRNTGAQGRKTGSDNEAKPDVGESRDVNRNMERGKSRRRSIARPVSAGQPEPAGARKLPNIQKSGKLLLHFNMRHFWMKTARNGWLSPDTE